MELALLTSEGALFILRWIHFIAGITWIGLLYYFNFVQGSFFGETEASVKSACIQKLVPRALWWFRWGAMLTFLTGWGIIMMRGHESGMELFQTSWGVTIMTGALFGSLMWFNVWFVIWPSQKVVIQNAIQTASGGQAIPEAAARATRATVASRTNTLLSITLLFMMGAASHLSIAVTPESNFFLYYLVLFLILGALEFNALKGKTGPMTTVKGVIHCGLALSIVMYLLVEMIL